MLRLVGDPIRLLVAEPRPSLPFENLQDISSCKSFHLLELL
jgi:hypothetical protein